MNGGHLEHFPLLQRWQYTGESAGQHGFACPRRTAEEQVVATGSSDFQCPFGLVLTDDVGHISIRFSNTCPGAAGKGLNRLIAIQVCTDFEQMGGGDNPGLLLRAASSAFMVGKIRSLPDFPQASEVGSTPSTGRKSPDSASSPMTSY